MTLNPGNNPYALFTGLDGRPLNGGKVYVGIAGQDPETNPQAIFWDADGIVSANNPMETQAGYLWNAGGPARFWTQDNAYSIRVRDRLGRQVFYAANVSFLVTAASFPDDPAQLAAITGKLVSRVMTAAEYRSLAQRIREDDRPSPFDFGAKGDGVLRFNPFTWDGTDDTAAIQATIDAVYAEGRGEINLPDRVFLTAGNLVMKPGVTLRGGNLGQRYYINDTGAFGGTLFKPDDAAALNGPLIEMATSSAVSGLYLIHAKEGGATTGIIRFGPMDDQAVLMNARVQDCHISGLLATGTTSGSQVKRGIWFPPSVSGKARYFNQVRNSVISECDFGVGLSSQSNANQFTGLTTRDCTIHYQLAGANGHETIENGFYGLSLFSMRSHAPVVPLGFLLQGLVRLNNFMGYNTEMHGKAYEVDAEAAQYINWFDGQANEVVSSFLPAGWDLRTDRGLNVLQKSQMLIPAPGTPGDFTFVGGNTWRAVKDVTGTLPNVNNNTGTIAANANSRIIARFGSTWFNKTAQPNFSCRLRVYADVSGVPGTAIADVEFQYRTANNTSAAGSLEVLRAWNKGGYITGLHFISGLTSGKPFAIALTGGNYAATPFTRVAVSLEVEAITSSGSPVLYTALSNVSFASEDVTAADVTDAISLLTVADTAI